MLKPIKLLYICFLTNGLFAQDATQLAKEVVNTIAADSYEGRGYINDGCKKAADYLAAKCYAYKLKKWSKDYFQSFKFNVNTFPDSLRVEVWGTLNLKKRLVPGKDYIVNPSSGSNNGIFKTVYVTEKNLAKVMLNLAKDEVLVAKLLNKKYTQDSLRLFMSLLKKTANTNPVIYLNHAELVFGVDDGGYANSFLEIKRSAFDSTASQVYIHVNNVVIKNFTAYNVAGYIKAKKRTNDFIVFTAHYDHLGKIGTQAIFNGANDNASGCGNLIALMDYYTKNKPDVNIAFIFFAGEEAGLIGSQYFTENPLLPLKNIRFLINLDLMGSGDEGITVVNGSKHKEEFELLKKINTDNDFLKQVKPRGEAQNSDHYWFEKKGVKTFFIYTMGKYSNYHDVEDRPEVVPMNKIEELVKLQTYFVKEVIKKYKSEEKTLSK